MKKSLWLTFFPLWILANIFGWLSYNVWFVIPYIGFRIPIVSALILGFLQWIVLHKYIEVESMWIWASIVPYMLIHLMFYTLNYFLDFDPLVFYEIVFAVFVLAGFLQSRVLDYYIPHARLWILINFVVALFGIPAAIIAYNLLIDFLETYLVFWLFFGGFYGFLTGVSLTLLETVFRKKQTVEV